MAVTSSSPALSASEAFLASVRRTPGGEKIQRCLQCGSCSGVCPFGYLMDFPPSRMITSLRASEFENVLAADSLWMCLACYACTSVCPVEIPLTQTLLTRAKEEMLLAGNVPDELQTALENSQRYGNVMGQAPRKRADWSKGLNPPVPVFGREKPAADVLWFVGDYPSYHPRVQAVSKAMAKVLRALGIDFAILGADEVSDGDSQRLAGERGLFEILASKNGGAFRKASFHSIVTTDPHAYNALKNEYPALGISFPVEHHTQFLARRLEDLGPKLARKLDKRIAFHDPCYLGRVNGIYSEPRELLAAIPGARIVEMSHNRSTSLCCGGGGGGMWLDGFQWEKAHTRTSDWRVQEAVAAGAEILAVACPYEPARFEDAAKGVPGGETLLIRDVVELLAESLGE